MRILVALLVFASACFAADYHWHVGQNVEYYIRNSDGKAIANIHKYSGDELWWIDAPGAGEEQYETREEAKARVENVVSKSIQWSECQSDYARLLRYYPKEYASLVMPYFCSGWESVGPK